MCKKILILIALLISLTGCQKNNENTIAKLVDEGYEISCNSFDEEKWKGLFVKEDNYLIVTANLNASLYKKIEDVFFEDDKYSKLIQTLEIATTTDITKQIPTLAQLQQYVGKTFGQLEEEGFEQTGYCERENNQFSFNYENNLICMIVVNSTDTPINDMDDFSENDLKSLVVGEVIDFYVSSNVLDSEEY